MLAVALIVDPLVVAICLRRNPYPLVFRCFKESGLTAFFTRSSAANIPGVITAPVNTINVYDILKYDKMVIAQDALAKLEEVYA